MDKDNRRRRLSRIMVFGGAAIMVSSAFLPWPWRPLVMLLAAVIGCGGLFVHPYFRKR
ncbi:MAG: hypothetical protein WD940_01850 [Patescibacteria group bacterium]